MSGGPKEGKAEEYAILQGLRSVMAVPAVGVKRGVPAERFTDAICDF